MDLMDRRRFLNSIMARGTKFAETGSFQVSEDTRAINYPITHGLGSTPDFVLVVADEIVASADYGNSKYIVTTCCTKSNYSSEINQSDGYAMYLETLQSSDRYWNTCEYITYSKFLKDDTFYVPYYNSGDLLKARVTYHYVVGKYE